MKRFLVEYRVWIVLSIAVAAVGVAVLATMESDDENTEFHYRGF